MSTPRGRRPGGPDTRGQILEAARESFAQKGFSGTTIRAVAAAAGVDPALVHHYYGSKDDLFLAALQIRVDPRTAVPSVLAEGPEQAGERLATLFLSVWDDPDARLPLIALVRASLTEDSAVNLLRDGMFQMVFLPLREALPMPDADRRIQLVATQLMGVVVARYLLELEPLVSMPSEELARWLGPTLQRYLTGDISEPV